MRRVVLGHRLGAVRRRERFALHGRQDGPHAVEQCLAPLPQARRLGRMVEGVRPLALRRAAVEVEGVGVAPLVHPLEQQRVDDNGGVARRCVPGRKGVRLDALLLVGVQRQREERLDRRAVRRRKAVLQQDAVQRVVHVRRVRLRRDPRTARVPCGADATDVRKRLDKQAQLHERRVARRGARRRGERALHVVQLKQQRCVLLVLPKHLGDDGKQRCAAQLADGGRKRAVVRGPVPVHLGAQVRRIGQSVGERIGARRAGVGARAGGVGRARLDVVKLERKVVDQRVFLRRVQRRREDRDEQNICLGRCGGREERAWVSTRRTLDPGLDQQPVKQQLAVDAALAPLRDVGGIRLAPYGRVRVGRRRQVRLQQHVRIRFGRPGRRLQCGHGGRPSRADPASTATGAPHRAGGKGGREGRTKGGDDSSTWAARSHAPTCSAACLRASWRASPTGCRPASRRAR